MARKKQKFYEVAEWGAMAMTSAIDFCLLDEKNDPRIVKFHILEYLFYLNNCFMKFKRFTFKQVLAYDRAYRVQQLRERFSWGTYVPELFEYYVSGRNKPTFAQRMDASKTKSANKNFRNPASKGRYLNSKVKDWYCDTFNKGDSCKYNPCRFLHQCSLCKQAHPKILCPLLKGVKS